MSDVTQILQSIDAGEPHAAERLLPLVYEELRKLAAAKLAHEVPGQTLDATALVHEAYLRLVGPAEREPQRWDGRGHFFAAAAEAMRRILVENARRKRRVRHGGGFQRADIEIDEVDVIAQRPTTTCWPSMSRSTPWSRPTHKPLKSSSCTISSVYHSRKQPRCSAFPSGRPTAIGLTPAPGCSNGLAKSSLKTLPSKLFPDILAVVGSGRCMDR